MICCNLFDLSVCMLNSDDFLFDNFNLFDFVMNQWNFNWSISVYLDKFVDFNKNWNKVLNSNKFLDFNYLVNKLFDLNCLNNFVSLSDDLLNKSINWDDLFNLNIVQNYLLFEDLNLFNFSLNIRYNFFNLSNLFSVNWNTNFFY